MLKKIKIVFNLRLMLVIMTLVMNLIIIRISFKMVCSLLEAAATTTTIMMMMIMVEWLVS